MIVAEQRAVNAVAGERLVVVVAAVVVAAAVVLAVGSGNLMRQGCTEAAAAAVRAIAQAAGVGLWEIWVMARGFEMAFDLRLWKRWALLEERQLMGYRPE